MPQNPLLKQYTDIIEVNSQTIQISVEKISIAGSMEPLSLFRWQPGSMPLRQPILIVPSIGFHAKNYNALVRGLLARGHEVYAINQRGQGDNIQVSGHIDRFSQLAHDLLQACNWIRYQTQQLPTLFLDHFGSVPGLTMAESFPGYVQGLAVFSPKPIPVLQFRQIKFSWLHFMADMVPTMHCPRLWLPRRVKAESFEPNQHFKASNRYVYEFMKELVRFPETVKHVDHPLLVVTNRPQSPAAALPGQVAWGEILGKKENVDIVQLEDKANQGDRSELQAFWSLDEGETGREVSEIMAGWMADRILANAAPREEFNEIPTPWSENGGAALEEAWHGPETKGSTAKRISPTMRGSD